MSGRGDIRQFLDLLSRYSELIEDCYHDGSVVMTEDNSSAIRILRNARVLATREEGLCGLTRVMREMLDENMQRQQRFAIGGNIGDEISRMEKLLFELEEAASQGKHAEIETYTADLSQSLYDIKDLITQDLLQFDQIMSTKFSDVRTIEEKMRQNKHYLERTKRLQDAVQQINSADLHARFSSALIGDAGRIYRVAISRSIADWSASLLSNSRVFEQFMFSFRNIAEETRRLRAFARFLKEGGQSRMEEAFGKADRYPVLCRVLPEEGDVWPDIISDYGRQACAVIVNGLKLTETRRSEERLPGMRAEANAPTSIEEDQALEDIALTAFLSQVSVAEGWLSASAWAQSHSELPHAVFLEHVLTWSETERDESFDARYAEPHAPVPRRANLAIEDIEVCRTA